MKSTSRKNQEKGKPSLYSYIVAHDTGFAPNPFWGYCTLACCKPAIRRTAKPGDWIVGLGPKSRGNNIIYVMCVKEKLTFDEYWKDLRFKKKKPDCSKRSAKYKCGDNIYKPLGKGKYRQLASTHSNPKFTDKQNPSSQKKDLSGEYVLVAKEFYYFGDKAIPLPERFPDLIVQRGHKCRFSEKTRTDFVAFLREYKRGIHGNPSIWPSNRGSCESGCK